MRLYFGGGEAPSLRNRLIDSGVTSIAINFSGLMPRLNAEYNWPSWEKFPDDVHVMLDSGGWAHSMDPTTMTDEEREVYLQALLKVVVQNIDRLDFVTEYDFVPWGFDLVKQGRTEFFERLEYGKFCPVWHPEWEELEELAAEYPLVGIPGSALRGEGGEQVAKRIAAAHFKTSAEFIGLGVTTTDLVKRARLGGVTSNSWTSSMRYGETVLWRNHTIERHRHDNREDVVRANRNLIQEAGVDPDEVIGGESDPLARLAIWSWMSWEKWLNGVVPQVTDTPPPPAKEIKPVEPVDIEPAHKWDGEVEEGLKLLPILSTEQTEDTGSFTLTTKQTSARVCNTCTIASYCPEFKADNSCAFSIPVELRDKGQLLGVMRTLLEMQAKRTMFSAFAEELEGAGPSKTTSREMDRFFEMAEKAKNITDDRDFMRISVEAHASGGVLSRLFGAKVGEQTRAIPPVSTDAVIAEVLDD